MKPRRRLVLSAGEIDRCGQFRHAAVPGRKFHQKEHARPRRCRPAADRRPPTPAGRKRRRLYRPNIIMSAVIYYIVRCRADNVHYPCVGPRTRVVRLAFRGADARLFPVAGTRPKVDHRLTHESTGSIVFAETRLDANELTRRTTHHSHVVAEPVRAKRTVLRFTDKSTRTCCDEFAGQNGVRARSSICVEIHVFVGNGSPSSLFIFRF